MTASWPVQRVAAVAALQLLASCTIPFDRPITGRSVITASQLYAAPQAYDGKRITVSGYLADARLIEDDDRSCGVGPAPHPRAIHFYDFGPRRRFLAILDHHVILTGRFRRVDRVSLGGGDLVVELGPDEVLGRIDGVRLLSVARDDVCAAVALPR